MATLSIEGRQDSKLFAESRAQGDSIVAEMEGGYKTTRPRHTRGPLKTFKFGFSDLSNAEKETLMAFYDAHSTHTIWQFTHPVSLTVYNVRFDTPIAPKYKGRGGFHFWECPAIAISEV